jgi:HlyD family secretion protein
VKVHPLKRKQLLITATAVVGLALLLLSFLTNHVRNPSEVLPISGTIEVTQTDVSFKIGGRIRELPIAEGTWVEQGQLLARLEDQDIQRQVELEEANLKVAETRLRELLTGSRPQEIEAAKQVLNQAESDLENRKKNYERIQALYTEGLASASLRDGAEASYKIALAAAKEAQERYELVRKGPRREEIDTARAQVERSKAMLGLAQVHLGYTLLTLPISGVVLVKNVEEGEVVSPGTPVVTIGDTKHPWLRAYINETDLGRVKWGQQVTVHTDTYPGKTYAGKISFISSESEFTPKSVQTRKERVTLVYRIKVSLENPHLELKPGMPAEGEISLHGNE